jgi:hypothetical protein
MLRNFKGEKSKAKMMIRGTVPVARYALTAQFLFHRPFFLPLSTSERCFLCSPSRVLLNALPLASSSCACTCVHHQEGGGGRKRSGSGGGRGCLTKKKMKTREGSRK